MTAEHFHLCPCGRCQDIRAALPVVTAMQAKHLSGASIGKLVEYTTRRSITTNEHLWSPIATLAVVSHGHEETNLTLQWDDYGLEESTLNPDDWVRVTSPNSVTPELLSELQLSPSISSTWQDPDIPPAGSNP